MAIIGSLRHLKKVTMYCLRILRKIVTCHDSLEFVKRLNNTDPKEPYLVEDIPRSRMFHTFLTMVNDSDIGGEFAELGVYKGGSARIIYRHASNRQLFLFDTFSGFADHELEKDKSVKSENVDDFTHTSVDAVLARLYRDCERKGGLVVKPGLFADTSKCLPDTVFAFVHIDCDLSEPINQGLEYFWPRMSCGAVVIIHDYISTKYPGVKVVVDKFFRDKAESVFSIMGKTCGSAVIIKG